ncbi:hypothetical protein [Pseudoalteromonas luteoviolacea]|nr:hypothetical protein [Pseudoalteromonas luteoviolacea]
MMDISKQQQQDLEQIYQTVEAATLRNTQASNSLKLDSFRPIYR